MELERHAALYLILKKSELNEVIPHGTRSVNCLPGLQHFNKYAYEYSQIN